MVDDSKETPESSFWCSAYVTPFSSVSIVEFEQVNLSRNFLAT